MLTLSAALYDLIAIEGLTTQVFDRFFRIALRGLDELRYRVASGEKCQRLDVPASRRIDLPDDFAAVRLVAVQVGTQLYPLHYDATLATLPATDSMLTTEAAAADTGLCPRPSGWDSWITAYAYLMDPTWAWCWGYEWQWTPGGYAIDREERCLYVGPNVPCETTSNTTAVVLIYTPYLTPCDENMEVDPLLQAALEHYILWRYYAPKPGMNGLAMQHKRDWEIQKEVVKSRFDTTDPLRVQGLIANS